MGLWLDSAVQCVPVHLIKNMLFCLQEPLSYYVTQCFQHAYLATSTLWGEEGQSVFGSNLAEYTRGSASFRSQLDHSPHTHIPEVAINALTTTKILPHAHVDIQSPLIAGVTSTSLPTLLTLLILQPPFLRPSPLGYPRMVLNLFSIWILVMVGTVCVIAVILL